MTEARTGVRVIGSEEGDAVTFRGAAHIVRKLASKETGHRWALEVAENPQPGFVNSPYTHPEPEAFILEGTYTFFTEGDDREVGPRTLSLHPARQSSRVRVGQDGGRLLRLWPAAFDT